MQTTLIPIIEHSAMLVGQAVPRACIDDIIKEIGADGDKGSVVSIIRKAWKAGRLEGTPEALSNPRPLDCPFPGIRSMAGWWRYRKMQTVAGWHNRPMAARFG